MTKRQSCLLTGIFCGFLAGLLALHLVLPDRERSQTENRLLAQWPSFSWKQLKDGTFTEDVEEYFADQFPFRDQWTGLKARAEQLLGKREFHDVYLCGDTLIAKVDPPEEDRMEKNLSYILRLADKAGVPVTLAFVPTAAEIWKEKLPAGAESWDQSALFTAAAESGLPAVDLYSALAAHRGEPVYYRTDHHWTSLGAFYGANALLEHFEMETLKESGFTVETASETFCGTLYSTSGIHWLAPDAMEFWVWEEGLSVTSWKSGAPEEVPLYDRTYLEKKDKYSAFLGGNQPLCVIKNENLTEGEKLLLLRDSYADALAPFLAQRFSEVHLLDLRYYRASPAQYAAENGISRIAVLYSTANFITDQNVVLAGQ